MLNAEYRDPLRARSLTDNGSEVASPRNKAHHPMEADAAGAGDQAPLHAAVSVPRPTGKVERFWRTLNEDLLEETTFESLEELKEELMQYLLYYNTERPHQGLGGKTPLQALELLSTN